MEARGSWKGIWNSVSPNILPIFMLWLGSICLPGDATQTGTKCAVNVLGEVGKQEGKVSPRKVPRISCLLTSHVWPCVSRQQHHSKASLPHQSWAPRLFLMWRIKHRQKTWFGTCFYWEKAKNTRNLTLCIFLLLMISIVIKYKRRVRGYTFYLYLRAPGKKKWWA